MLPPFAGTACSWATYVDPETGTTVDYPANVFSAKDEKSDPASEGHFHTPDRNAKMRVYFLPNEEHETPRSYIEHHLRIARSDLTYDRITNKFFAISGRRGEATFYSRCNFAPENRNMHSTWSIRSGRSQRGTGSSQGSAAHSRLPESGHRDAEAWSTSQLLTEWQPSYPAPLAIMGFLLGAAGIVAVELGPVVGSGIRAFPWVLFRCPPAAARGGISRALTLSSRQAPVVVVSAIYPRCHCPQCGWE
jgi:hypothetical protein